LNTKAIYAAGGGIAVAAVIVFFVLGANNNSQLPGISNSNNNNQGANSTGGASGSSSNAPNIMPPVINVKDIAVKKAGDSHANVQVTFTVKNPNNTTMILETIHYNVNVDGLRMTIGDVGQSAQGFLDSQSNLFPIVSGSTLTAKDTQTVERNSAIAGAWDKMVAGNTTFTVDGTYSYRLTAANLQTTAEDRDFSLTFP
jgi:hypothetical protein